ncbi:MAG: SpoIIE family protein phosphatase [Proteobacteria bacterium]|nr:SpoIIE family protein phosphatase [Pseudomonadota bacterium]
MKIRTHLLISYVVVIVVTLLLTVGLTYLSLEDQSESNLKAAQDAVREIAQANFLLSKKILTDYGHELVRLQAEGVAKELSLLLRDRTHYDYEEIRRDETLRRIATQDIFTRRGRAGYLDLVDNTGVAVLHPNKSVEGRNFSEWKAKFPEMWTLVERSFTEPEVKGYYSFVDRKNREQRKYMVLVQVPDTPFIVVGAVNIREFFMPAWNEIGRSAAFSQNQASINIGKVNNETISSMRRTTFLGVIVALVVGLLFALWFSASVSTPILDLCRHLAEIGKGRFQLQVQPTGMAEVQQLARTFNRLGGQLTDYTERLEAETAAREAVLGEVRVARQIQVSLLPHVFPPFPERTGFSLFADNVPAKEVGGDFYDFFLIDDDRLAVLIADVSGKGVPAALFMAMARTLFRFICPDEPDPARAVEKANDVLCQDNDACMFVTLFLAYFDPDTGALDFTNAGHNPPFLLKPGGSCNEFGRQGGRALGIVPGQRYASERLDVERDDLLVFYTDGVVDASSPTSEFFGEERFRNLLCSRTDQPVEAISRKIIEAVDAFQAGELFDDVTILVMRRE